MRKDREKGAGGRWVVVLGCGRALLLLEVMKAEQSSEEREISQLSQGRWKGWLCICSSAKPELGQEKAPSKTKHVRYELQ